MPFLNDKDNITYCVELTPGHGVELVDQDQTHRGKCVLLHKSDAPRRMRVRKEVVNGNDLRWQDGWLDCSTGVITFDNNTSLPLGHRSFKQRLIMSVVFLPVALVRVIINGIKRCIWLK